MKKEITYSRRLFYNIIYMHIFIANDYRLEGPVSNPGGDEIFRSSRTALGPNQPPVKLVPGLSRGLSVAEACC